MSEFDYYEQEHYEPSALEQLEIEFSEKAKALLNEDFKNYVASIKEREESLELQRSKLSKERLSLNEEHQKLVKEKDNFETHKNQVISAMLSKFGLNLVPNQRVYVIERISESHILPTCPHCQSTGKLNKIIDGIEYVAPCSCKGRKLSYTYTYAVHAGNVSDVRVSLYWDTRKQTLENYRDSYGWESKETYVYVNNLPCGLDTGYTLEEVFLTKEDALAEVERLKAKDNNS